MKRLAIASVIILAVLGASVGVIALKSQSPPTQPVKTAQKPKKFVVEHTGTVELSPTKITELINAYRITNGLPALTPIEGLIKAAQEKCADLQKYGTFAHYIPASGVGIFYYSQKEYPNAVARGENLAEVNSVDNNFPVQGWINSPEHKANILNPSYIVTGVTSCNQDPYWTRSTDTRYVVQEFAD